MGNKEVRFLRDVNPSLYAELHPTLNTIDTTSLTPHTNKKVWWQCSKEPFHYWSSTVSHRSVGKGCPMCAGRLIVHGVNDLSVFRPDVYAELHPTMNTIDTRILSVSSNKKVWWQCSKNPSHYWETIVANRSNGSGCAMCASMYIVHGVNDLSVENPSLYAELHSTMNVIDTTTLSPSSGKKVWWQCTKNIKHYWQAGVNDRSKYGCGMCAGMFVVHGINDLSVLRPDLYAELHPTMNTVDTSILTVSTRRKVWWQCSKNETHYWNTSVASRSKGGGCAMCSGYYIVYGISDLSVLRPDLYAELHPTMNIIDTSILSGSTGKKVWWQCSKNETHYWNIGVEKRAQGSGCAMCAGMFVVHGINDLSVFRPDLYAELHPTMNTVDTSILTVSSNKKIWWQCPKNVLHYWRTSVANRSVGKGCPHCVTYRNEFEFRNLFTKVTNLEFSDGHIMGERELFKKNQIQIDMINHEHSVIIEYDGAFTHGGNKLHKTTLEYCLAKDIDTTSTLLNAGYRVVRIRETPLQFLEMQHENLLQVAFKDRDDKLPVVMSAVEALQTMDVDIKMKDKEINEL